MESGIAYIVFIFVFAFAIFGLWIFALISAATTAKNKVLWVLLIALFPGPGSLAWFLLGERVPKKKISYLPRRKLRGGANAGSGPSRGTGTKMARRPLRR